MMAKVNARSGFRQNVIDLNRIAL